MITLKRLNVVRKVATEEQAAKFERLGFIRQGGAAEVPAGTGLMEADLAKMGEAMFANLCGRVDSRVDKRVGEAMEAKGGAAEKGKPAKGGKKEERKDGGTGQPDSGDGAKRPEADG